MIGARLPMERPEGSGDAGRPPEPSQRQLEQAVRFLSERDDFLVVSHVQPDGDAISSTLVVGWLLKRLGKRYTLYNEGPVPSKFQFLPGSGDIVTAASSKPERAFSHIVCVDCADFDRVGQAKAWFAEGAELLNIDHHPTNDGFGSVNLLRFEAAATAEILHDLLEQFPWALDRDAATALYVGLLTDTGGFRYANTSPRVMAIASRLLKAGADGPDLAQRLLEQMTMGQIRMMQRALSRLSFTEDRRIGWLWVSGEDLSETGATNEDLEGLVNYPRNIEGVEVGMLFKQHAENAVKISLRSAGRVDVAAIARTFGGGGHVRAAGCRYEGPLEEAVSRLVGAVQKALDER